jgi:two-component system response regulator QseB
MAIRMRVLLLEDHTALREMIGDHLTQRGFAVDGFGRGDEASAAAAVAAYDAIILDLGLPDVDGMEVLATIRAVRADDYLVKPFALVELEARLRAVLRRPGQRTEVVYSCGSLTFDPASRVAAVSERVLDLSRRESALLEELLRARGRVVIKDVLEERLYGFDEAVSRNALEATVSRLRRSLGECGAGVRIETKRGIGYRLIAEEPR